MIEKSPQNKAMSAGTRSVERPVCATCGYYDMTRNDCRREPVAIDKHQSDWCGEHTDFPAYLKSLTTRG